METERLFLLDDPRAVNHQRSLYPASRYDINALRESQAFEHKDNQM